jgi:5'-methylthioadenosine phosphorylase
MKVAVITGSGSYALAALEGESPRSHATPFGEALVTHGPGGTHELLHISRHEPGHRRLSNHVAHQANVWALRDLGAEAVLAVTVCGALDPTLELGSLIVFDDLHFIANRLPDGSLCSLHTEPGARGRAHWVFDRPFSERLRAALTEGARTTDRPLRVDGCYGHVDGPRFNTRTEIRALSHAGVTAVSQTAGPETVLCGEAGLPYALLGFATDYANGVTDEPTPVSELMELIAASTLAFTTALAGALAALPDEPIAPTGTQIGFA